MGEYDAVWVFLFSAIFVGFYIFIEARPKGSTFIKNITKNSLRKLIGLVTQDSILFNDTIKNNLLVAKNTATDDEIIVALKINNFKRPPNQKCEI